MPALMEFWKNPQMVRPAKSQTAKMPIPWCREAISVGTILNSPPNIRVYMPREASGTTRDHSQPSSVPLNLDFRSR